VRPSSVPTEPGRRRAARSERWRRLAWWLAAGLPVVGASLVLLSENLHLPDPDQGHDVSSICLLLLGAFATAVGIARTITAIARGRGALNDAQRRLTDATRHAVLLEAYGIRLRSAWLIIVGTGLSMFGGYLVWLVIGAE